MNWSLHLQHTVGNQAAQRLLQANADGFEAGFRATTSDRISYQPKLVVSSPGDIYEKEADGASEDHADA